MRKLIPFAFLLLCFVGMAQLPPNTQEPIMVTGTVIDNETGQPLEYATLIL
jgi:hypothetical protein